MIFPWGVLTMVFKSFLNHHWNFSCLYLFITLIMLFSFLIFGIYDLSSRNSTFNFSLNLILGNSLNGVIMFSLDNTFLPLN